MKLFPIAIVAALLGAGLGVAIAHVQVGEVEGSFTGPEIGPDGAPQASIERDYPESVVDEPVYDFGTMQRGTTATHDFVIKNVGKAPLSLEVGATSCKCTLGDVESGPIAPGESAPVRLEWVAKSLPGKFRQTANVLTNDPRQPTIELAVEGIVTETTGMQPTEFLLGQMVSEESRSATVYLAAYGDEPLVATARMTDDTRRPELFDLVVEDVPLEELPIERATSGVKITVTASPGLPLGHVTEWVEVQTNAESSKPEPDTAGADEAAGDASRGTKLLIPLLAVVEGDITLHGAGWAKNLGVLIMGKVKSSEGESAKLRVAIKGDHADGAELTVGEVDPEWLEVEVGDPKAIREGVTHIPVTVTVPPGRPAVIRSGEGAEAGGQGDGDARVTLLTNHPSTPEVDVRVRFVVAE